MNKKVLGIVAVLLLLLLAGYFYMTKGKGGTPGYNTGSSTSTSTSSLKDLLTKGVAQSCTFSNEGSTGTVYVAGGKMRGDFDSVTEGKTVKSHMIVDGNTSYIWMDGEKTGFKMSFDPASQPSGSGAPTGGFDTNASMNYKCGTWITDSTQFTPPSNVTFTSFDLPSAAPAQTGGTQPSQCSYCSSLTGDDKTQCLAAFKCN